VTGEMRLLRNVKYLLVFLYEIKPMTIMLYAPTTWASILKTNLEDAFVLN
jgi:hypothetical protein